MAGRMPDLQSGGCGFESRPGLLHTSTQPSIPPGSVNEAGKAKAGMADSDCG